MQIPPCSALALMALIQAPLQCGDSALPLDQAVESIEPHRASFRSFDGWARRAQITERMNADREALSDATFAPVRNQQRVLAAWVEREPERSLRLSLPPETQPPQPSGWARLRDPGLGAVRVAAAEPCPVELPRWWRQGRAEGPCVIISRTERAASDHLTVTVAFASEPQPSQSEATR